MHLKPKITERCFEKWFEIFQKSFNDPTACTIEPIFLELLIFIMSLCNFFSKITPWFIHV